MPADDSHRQRARRAINAARRGHLPKPKANLNSDQPTTSSTTEGNNVFESARENSIEVYDDKFGRNSILTRSARMRKFKFYQYKPIQDTATNTTPKSTNSTRSNNSHNDRLSSSTSYAQTSSGLSNNETSPQSPGPAILLPRDDVLQGKVKLVAEQSKELCDLDNQIVELEKKIADLNSNGNRGLNNLDELFDLVNKKNDLLRRQMQLNILEQEKVLEKANEELTKELRSLMSIEDSKKTIAQLERQQYLYDQSLALVNKRNELVYHMDIQEKGIEEDNALKATLKSVISNTNTRNRINGHQEQNCCIQ